MPLAFVSCRASLPCCTCGLCPRRRAVSCLFALPHAHRPRQARCRPLRRHRRPVLVPLPCLALFWLFPVPVPSHSGAMPLRGTAPAGRLSSWHPAARPVSPCGLAFCFIPPPPMPVTVGLWRQCARPCSSRLRSPHYGARPRFRPPPGWGSHFGRPHGFAVLALCLFQSLYSQPSDGCIR